MLLRVQPQSGFRPDHEPGPLCGGLPGERLQVVEDGLGHAWPVPSPPPVVEFGKIPQVAAYLHRGHPHRRRLLPQQGKPHTVGNEDDHRCNNQKRSHIGTLTFPPPWHPLARRAENLETAEDCQSQRIVGQNNDKTDEPRSPQAGQLDQRQIVVLGYIKHTPKMPQLGFMAQVLEAHPTDGREKQKEAIACPPVQPDRPSGDAQQENDTPYDQNADKGEETHRVTAKVSEGEGLKEDDPHQGSPGESLKELALSIGAGEDELSYDDRHEGHPGQVSQIKRRKAKVEQNA